MSGIRIFSYLPNPRIWKATIAARILGVNVEVRGVSGGQLSKWLWDFDARELTESDKENLALRRQGRTGFRGELYKTDAFMQAHPYGTVPAAFSDDGTVGIFESNSIMRVVARLGDATKGLYGTDAYTASRIDSFLDASLVFARDSQIYLLALGGDGLTKEVHDRAKNAFESWMGAIERTIQAGEGYIVGNQLTLADICFVAEYSLFSRERAWTRTIEALGSDIIDWTIYPAATDHYEMLCENPNFVDDLRPFRQKLAQDIEKHGG